MGTMIRAAVDMGSGSTKLLVCSMVKGASGWLELDKVIYEQETNVLLSRDLEQNNNGRLSDEVLCESRNVLKGYKDIAIKHGFQGPLKGIATQVFRLAENGEEYLKSLEQDGIEIKMVSQQKEAEIGFATASALYGGDPALITSWDTGGSSSQVTWDGGSSSFLVPLGSIVTTAAMVRLQGKDYSKIDSPNPVTETDISMLREHINSILREADPNPPVRDWCNLIGIGGESSAFNNCKLAIDYALGEGKSLSSEHLTKAAKALVGMTDEQLSKAGFVSQPQMVVPKIVLINTIMDYLNMSKLEYRSSTGSCLGVIALENT